MQNIGINTVHIDVAQVLELGMGRMEMCLGRAKSYEDRLNKMEGDIEGAKKEGIPFSVHLPMYIGPDFQGDYLDVFFLDPNPQKRQVSFDMLEDNLKKMVDIGPEYCVLHFSGLYRDVSKPFTDFDQVLKEALERIDGLSERYGIRILLEYMASNARFYHYQDWIDAISPYEHIGMITDTGHLHFACLMHGFDFTQALSALSHVSEAYHLWTTKGPGAYEKSEHYRTFHHIVPHTEQRIEEAWAFNTTEIVKLLRSTGKPIIVEAFNKYKGEAYFYEGIKSVIKLIQAYGQ